MYNNKKQYFLNLFINLNNLFLVDIIAVKS